LNRQFIEVPPPLGCGWLRKTWHRLTGTLLLPGYLLSAIASSTPGALLHARIASLAFLWLLQGRIPFSTCYNLCCFPMESTRYFEYHEVLSALSKSRHCNYLDVSSPRLVPLLLTEWNHALETTLINPDKRDLQQTQRLVESLRLTDRCTLRNSTIEELDYASESFDLITCISVLEHIPADNRAVELMWSLLHPGGRLILTLPCMAQPLEQYISHNHYNILKPGSDGYTFWQRYYDEQRLESVVYSTTGSPAKMVVYGEKRPGLFFRNAFSKRQLGSLYPYWRESYMMSTDYRYYQKISDLPGEGVLMAEFKKP
jgi:SAM-dependent methyltransferase